MTGRKSCALVTGATGKVGAALVERLAARGMTVHAMGRRRAALEELAAATGCIPAVADLTDTSAIEACLADIEPDVLVCNAGLGRAGSIAGESAAGIDAMLDVNLRSAMQLLRLVMPGMIARDRGHIVFIGSMAGHHSFAGHAAYHATKAGVAMLARQARIDLIGHRVRVSEISPGRIRTDMFAKALDLSGEEAEKRFFEGYEPLLPEDIADAVEYAIAAPERVNVGLIEIFPTMQVAGGMTMAKGGAASDGN